MGISVLSGSQSDSIKWNAQDNLTGTDYSPLQNAGGINKQQTFNNNIANNATGGANQFVSYLFTIASSGNATVNCTTLTNILQTSNVALVRIKGYVIRLLSITDDTVNGTNCSQVTWGNASSNQQNLVLATNATAFVYNGGISDYFDQRPAGFAVSNTACNIKFLNNDSGNAACVQLTLIGGDS
jgi:hypothetical protein